jgi:excisionase family DNA binding protein
MEMSPLLLDKKTAAKALSISVRMLEYLISGGKLQTHRIGRRVLVPYGSLRRFAGERAIAQKASGNE